MVPGGMRNIHDNKVSGQISSNSANHNARHGSNEDYMNIVHRLGNEVNMRKDSYQDETTEQRYHFDMKYNFLSLILIAGTLPECICCVELYPPLLL